MDAHEDRLRRCDRCGAPPKFEVLVAPGLELLFCLHHASEHSELFDERHYPQLPLFEKTAV